MVNLPLDENPGACLYAKLILSTFFPSTFTGDFTVLVNEGLSILTVNS